MAVILSKVASKAIGEIHTSSESVESVGTIQQVENQLLLHSLIEDFVLNVA